MRIDVYLHVEPDSEVLSRLAVITRQLDLVLKVERRMETEMNLDFTKMAAAAARQKEVSDSALAYLQAQSATLTTIRQQLADAIAQNDPAATAAAQKALDDFAVGIDANDDAIAAAIATPGPVTEPPAEVAPAEPVVGGRRR